MKQSTDASHIVDQLTEAVDETNLCVVLRPGENGLEALIVYDEQDRPSIPGGHAKGDESHAQAAKREVKEETGLDVEPQQLFWAKHAARGPGRHTNLFYATAGEFDEGKPGGGDVTRLYWAPVTNLGELNGTDRLAIHIAANRVHSPQDVVDDAVALGESMGYAVGTVAAPPPEVPGLYMRLGGEKSGEFALKLKAWAESLGWPVVLCSSKLFESTTDALERASKNRRLTPMLEAIIRVADALWRYESLISPALAKGHIVIETGPGIDIQRVIDRGLPPDLLNAVASRVKIPKLYFGVDENLEAPMLQMIQDTIEQLKTPDPDDPNRYLNQLTTSIQCPKCRETNIAAHAIGPQQGFNDPTAACSHCGHRDVRSAFYRRIVNR